MSDLWRFFECANSACESKQLDKAGVVLQVRMPVSLGPRGLLCCPVCGDPMQPGEEVLATESGHLPNRMSEEWVKACGLQEELGGRNPGDQSASKPSARPRLTWKEDPEGWVLLYGVNPMAMFEFVPGFVRIYDFTSNSYLDVVKHSSLRDAMTYLRQHFLTAGFSVGDLPEEIAKDNA